MKVKLLWIGCLTAVLAALVVMPVYATVNSAAADDPAERDPSACRDGTQESGALYRICMPQEFFGWNNRLVIYAHGYVAPNEPLAIPAEADDIATAVNFQRYAFATTSYYTNGLAIEAGLSDIVDLVDLFAQEEMTPTQVLLLGFSEGGIITTLAIERRPDLFTGGVAACGPLGGLPAQMDYIGDFRVLFDYFFPDVFDTAQGSPTEIDPALMANWDTFFADNIQPVVTAPENEEKVAQLLRVARAPENMENAATTIENVLWYNVFGTNDAAAKLGGNPYENVDRVYVGSDDDETLNANVVRITADPAARTAAAERSPTGDLTIPLVTAHTTEDEVVPGWHAHAYRNLIYDNNDLALHDALTYERYGHCNFTQDEVLAAFDLLEERIANPVDPIETSRLFIPFID